MFADMGTKMDDKELLIYKRIDEILWNDWDPIGVKEFPEARDEYQSYIYRIYELKKAGASIEILAKELNDIEMHRMGIFRDISKCLDVAKKVAEI
jgi:hypothetical protein